MSASIINRVIAKTGRTAVAAANVLGILPLISKPGCDGIIMYHGVIDRDDPDYSLRHLGIDTFEFHLKQLQKYFNIVPVKELFEEKSSGRPRLAITFDDGYRNNYTHAFPVLKKMSLPASIYVTGGDESQNKILWSDMHTMACKQLKDFRFRDQMFSFSASKRTFVANESGETIREIIKNADEHLKQKFIDFLWSEMDFHKDVAWDDYWKLMDRDMIREMDSSGLIEIGSHGFYHNNLGRIPINQAVEEVKKSKKYLEEICQRNIDSIAFPDGSYTPELCELIQKEGFQYQLAVRSTAEHMEKMTYLKDRMGIYPVYSKAWQLWSIVRNFKS